jgi:hypothetical protein
MSTAPAQREVDTLVDRLKKLVTERRSLLESSDASASALSDNSDAIARVREQLAGRAKQLGDSRPQPPGAANSGRGPDALNTRGVAHAGRIEAPGGDLHQSGMNGELVELFQAWAAIAVRKAIA